MIIGLASPSVALTLEDGLSKVERLVSQAAAGGAEIVCFPEAYLPGLRGVDLDVLPFGELEYERVLQAVARFARTYSVAIIFGMEQPTADGTQNVAVVFDAKGELLGYQTKNQIAPTEDPFYVPGHARQLFDVNGVKFGVVICHEGWRYPETVRWAAVRGAKIVFHPQHTGSNQSGPRLTRWGSAEAPYYEKAMVCRSVENTIYFASINYALRFAESATCVIDPNGQCQAYLPYGQEGVLVQSIDVNTATGLLASRFASDRF